MVAPIGETTCHRRYIQKIIGLQDYKAGRETSVVFLMYIDDGYCHSLTGGGEEILVRLNDVDITERHTVVHAHGDASYDEALALWLGVAFCSRHDASRLPVVDMAALMAVRPISGDCPQDIGWDIDREDGGDEDSKGATVI